MRDVTWFLTNWHWFAGVLALAVILVIAGAVLALRAGEGDPSEVARFDAYLDDVEDGYIDLPGPALGPLAEPGTGPERRTGRAGEPDREIRVGPSGSWRSPDTSQLGERGVEALSDHLHYMDTWLGRPGDGSEHTALRVRREGEAMLARVEAARRELAAECGIRYVPMELVAA